jgi:aspartyl-tRNA(Asn)/glutamyl-tRNA(Gln) amidotransferase subunit A
MANEEYADFAPSPLSGLRAGIVQGLPLEGLDDTVAKTFPAALKRLEKAGILLSEEKLSLIDDMVAVNAKGGLAPPESLMIHRDRLARRGDAIDPHVRVRIERAAKIGAADYVDMQQTRFSLIARMDARLADVDFLVSPTTPIVAPTIAEMEEAETFGRKNGLLLRNTNIWNFFDCCAISLPLPRENGHNTGLMLIMRNGQDKRLFRIAAAVEKLLAA